MTPITVSVDVDRPREEVFAFLDVLANHEPFTNHMLVDWSYDGPAKGVGAKARFRPNMPGPKLWSDLEVTGAQGPETIIEATVSAGRKRRTRGTYTLQEKPGGGTHVQFELAFVETPLMDRLGAPLTRGWLKKANAKAM